MNKATKEIIMIDVSGSMIEHSDQLDAILSHLMFLIPKVPVVFFNHEIVNTVNTLSALYMRPDFVGGTNLGLIADVAAHYGTKTVHVITDHRTYGYGYVPLAPDVEVIFHEMIER